jgi:hypothetical protein
LRVSVFGVFQTLWLSLQRANHRGPRIGHNKHKRQWPLMMVHALIIANFLRPIVFSVWEPRDQHSKDFQLAKNEKKKNPILNWQKLFAANQGRLLAVGCFVIGILFWSSFGINLGSLMMNRQFHLKAN